MHLNSVSYESHIRSLSPHAATHTSIYIVCVLSSFGSTQKSHLSRGNMLLYCYYIHLCRRPLCVPRPTLGLHVVCLHTTIFAPHACCPSASPCVVCVQPVCAASCTRPSPAAFHPIWCHKPFVTLLLL